MTSGTTLLKGMAVLLTLVAAGASSMSARADSPKCPAAVSAAEASACKTRKIPGAMQSRIEPGDWCAPLNFQEAQQCVEAKKRDPAFRRLRPQSPCPGYATAEEAVRAASEYARAKGLKLPAAEPRASWHRRAYLLQFFATPRKSKGGEIQVFMSMSGDILACKLNDGSPCAPFPDRSKSVCQVEGPHTLSESELGKIATDHLDRHGVAHYPVNWRPLLKIHDGWMVQFPAEGGNEAFSVSVNWDGKARNLMPGM